MAEWIPSIDRGGLVIKTSFLFPILSWTAVSSSWKITTLPRFKGTKKFSLFLMNYLPYCIGSNWRTVLKPQSKKKLNYDIFCLGIFNSFLVPKYPHKIYLSLKFAYKQYKHNKVENIFKIVTNSLKVVIFLASSHPYLHLRWKSNDEAIIKIVFMVNIVSFYFWLKLDSQFEGGVTIGNNLYVNLWVV